MLADVAQVSACSQAAQVAAARPPAEELIIGKRLGLAHAANYIICTDVIF